MLTYFSALNEIISPKIYAKKTFPIVPSSLHKSTIFFSFLWSANDFYIIHQYLLTNLYTFYNIFKEFFNWVFVQLAWASATVCSLGHFQHILCNC